MKREKAHKLLDKIIDGSFERGWDVGHSAGYSDGFDDGQMTAIEASKEYVKRVMEQSVQLDMDSGNLRSAKATKDVMDWLFALWNYDPVEAERKRKEEEENSDGFGLIL